MLVQFFCPNKEAAKWNIVVACPPRRITPLYRIPLWIFYCVTDMRLVIVF